MSVPPEIMQRMMAGGRGGPPPQPPQAPPGAVGAQSGQSPAAAPLSKPQDKRGLKAAAHTNIHIAVNMLEEALPAFGSESPEGAKILSALKSLSMMVGKNDNSDLVPAEVLQMVRRLPQMGGGTQVQQAIMKQMQGPQAPPAAA